MEFHVFEKHSRNVIGIITVKPLNKKFAHYWEVSVIGRKFKKDCHIWDLTFCPLFVACSLFRMSAFGRFHCIIGYVISGATVDKKSNFAAWVVSYVIHAHMFVKRHKSDDLWEIFLFKIKVVESQMNREYLPW